METKKAGCYLLNKSTKCIALVFREKYNDYTFPKGHLEDNETFIDCAIRETAEETKRIAKIVENIPPIEEFYSTKTGELCKCVMFVAIDGGQSDNQSTDTHPVVWTPIEEVSKKLSYESLRDSWNTIKSEIFKLL